MPPWFERVYTTGHDEDFSFLPETDPSKTYVMVPELSDHTPAYLWGDKLRTLFEALGEGYSIAATMHADSPQEVVAMLREQPVSVPGDLIASIGVVVNLLLSDEEEDATARGADKPGFRGFGLRPDGAVGLGRGHVHAERFG